MLQPPQLKLALKPVSKAKGTPKLPLLTNTPLSAQLNQFTEAKTTRKDAKTSTPKTLTQDFSNHLSVIVFNLQKPFSTLLQTREADDHIS